MISNKPESEFLSSEELEEQGEHFWMHEETSAASLG